MEKKRSGQPGKAGAGPGGGTRPDQATPLSLLERARARNPDAWGRLVELYRPLVLYWCGRAGLRGPDAEDVAQEVFAGAAAGLADFQRDRPGDTFRGWLRGITRNQVLLHFRRARGKPQAAGGSDAWNYLQGVADPLADPAGDEAGEMSHLYRRAVEQVRDEFQAATWEAFWRTVIEGRSPAALADELGMTEAAIRQAKSRVLRRLKQELGELLE
jgi:RNA polymerase sigma-70 factor, ECF subfamily